MHLSLQQVNDLITGIGLAAELPASAPELRRFVDIHGYEVDDQGISQQLSKFICQDNRHICRTIHKATLNEYRRHICFP